MCLAGLLAMAQNQYRLTVSSSPAFCRTSVGEALYMAGERVAVEAYPNSYFKFICWEKDGATVSTSVLYEFDMPAGDVDLTARFEFAPGNPPEPDQIERYKLYLKSEPEGIGGFNYESGTVFSNYDLVELNTWSRNSSFKFAGWKWNGNFIGSNGYSLAFYMNADVEVTAVFEFNPDNPGDPLANSWNPLTGELIMDKFQPGYLQSAAYEKVDYNPSPVLMLTVAGKMDPVDYYIGSLFENAVSFDFSRTYGCSYVESWAFGNDSTVESVIIPETIEGISNAAFYYCTSLVSLTVLAKTPPSLGYSVFDGCENLTVYVPYESLSLYEDAYGWSDLDIQPIREQVVDLQVVLPSSKAGMYKNMTLELTNLSSGVQYRHVVTDAVAYRFSNLPRNTMYSVFLKNGQGVELGSITDIFMESDDREVEFQSLLDVCDITMQVSGGQEDLTSAVTVNWYDGDGNYLSGDASVKGIVEGTVLEYRIVLPQQLAMTYVIPQNGRLTAESGGTFKYTLEPLGKATFNALVKDLTTGNPIQGAIVTVSQKLNGLYSKSSARKTGQDGSVSVEAYITPDATVSFAHKDYVGSSMTVACVLAANNLGQVELRSITGARVGLTLNFHKSTVNGPATPEPYFSPENVSYSVFNVTKNTPINQFSVQYPEIVLLEEVDESDVIRIVAHSVTEQFQDVTALAVIDERQTASAVMDIFDRGGVTAKYLTTDNASVAGILYNGNGEMLQKLDYENGQLTVTGLAEGRYSIVSMARSTLFNSFSTVQAVLESGLTQYVDFMLDTLTVKDGTVTTVTNQSIPFLDETKLYYTGSNASFYANKASVIAGNYITLKGRIEFKEEYASAVDDVSMVIDLPENCSFVNASVMVGNEKAGYYVDGNRITIPVSNFQQQQIKLCVIPMLGGSYPTSAYVRFKLDGQEILQPVGVACFAAKNLSIAVPAVVARSQFSANGTAQANCEVNVYDGQNLIGQTTSLANGSWFANVELFEPEDKSEHQIYAKVQTGQGLLLQSETATLLYDQNAIEVSKVSFFHHNPEMGRTYRLDFDFLNPSTKSQNYVYYIYNRKFTFTLDFTDNRAVKCAGIYVKSGTGNLYYVTAAYNAGKDIWVAEGNFGNYYDGDIPVNVDVIFSTGSDSIRPDCNSNRTYINPDVNVIIDPSGYVYEAVESNRLEGVRTTAFYKEQYEDQYGDMHERETLWDAEKYAQENPLFTDEDGMYRWDVPQGTWRVKYEKDGYVTGYSEWLPVPPPQLEVNYSMVKTSAPQVKKVIAFEDGVEIEFDNYMLVSTLNGANISLQQNGKAIPGSFTMLNEEMSGGKSLASKLRFEKSGDASILTTSKLGLTISKKVSSYSGIQMDQDYTQEFDIVKEVKSILVQPMINVLYGNAKEIQVSTVPFDAAIGKALRIVSGSDIIASVTESAIIDNEGKATIQVDGELPGTTTISLSIDGSSASVKSTVDVTKVIKKVDAPVATKASGTQLYRGSKIVLSSSTDGAVIYYTIDGSDPSTSSPVYSGPITVNGNMTIRTFAVAEGYDEASDTAMYIYTLKKSNVGLTLNEGWNWVSHNLEGSVSPQQLIPDGISRILDIETEAVNDPVYGMVGNLKQLEPVKNYKVLMSKSGTVALDGYEIDAANTNLTLAQGWNWIGYPVNQSTSLAEAFEYAKPSPGDVIIGQDGYAEYCDGEWIGTLSKMDPGKGYLYKSVSGMVFTYNTNLVSLAAARFAPAFGTGPWKCDSHAYPDIMAVTANVSDGDGYELDPDRFILGAFVGDECRGVASSVAGLFMMNVYGKSGDLITFKIVGKQDMKEYSVTGSMKFNQGIVGSIRNPFDFTVNGTTGIDLIPVEKFAYGSFLNLDGFEGITEVSVCNMAGVRLFSTRRIPADRILDLSFLENGTYLVNIETEKETKLFKLYLTE